MPRFSKDETIQFPKDVTLSHLLSKPWGFLVLSSLATVQKDFRQILDSHRHDEDFDLHEDKVSSPTQSFHLIFRAIKLTFVVYPLRVEEPDTDTNCFHMRPWFAGKALPVLVSVFFARNIELAWKETTWCKTKSHMIWNKINWHDMTCCDFVWKKIRSNKHGIQTYKHTELI